MMHRILDIISEGRVSSVEGLAEKLGIESGLVTLMLEDLVLMGLLSKKTSGGRRSCGSSCRGCCAGDCSANSEKTVFWILSGNEKKEIKERL